MRLLIMYIKQAFGFRGTSSQYHNLIVSIMDRIQRSASAPTILPHTQLTIAQKHAKADALMRRSTQDKTIAIVHWDVFGWLEKELKIIASLNEGCAAFPTREEHNAYWRSIFADLIADIQADVLIRNDLTTPSTDRIGLVVRAWPIRGHYCCPCDLG